jgi:CheY-like chemotaxis protein
MKRTNHATPAPAFRILLVDDNRNGLLARKSVLEEQGYTVTAFSTPADALEEFAANRYDLVVTDYRRPGMKGTELIACLREIAPAIPIVLISGMVDVLGLNEKNTGADAVIAKNSHEVQHITRAVNRLLLAKIPRKTVRKQTAKTRSTRASGA